MLDKNSESRVHVEAIEEPPPPGKSIAFGLERMGLIASGATCLHASPCDRGRRCRDLPIKIEDSMTSFLRFQGLQAYEA